MFEIPLSQTLLEYLHSDPLDGLKLFLTEHPIIMSTTVYGELVRLETFLRDKGSDEEYRAVRKYRLLVQLFWELIVSGSLTMPTTACPCPQLLDEFNKHSIHTRDALHKSVLHKPELRQAFCTLALNHLSNLDWEVFIFIAYSSSDRQNIIDVIIKFPNLLEFEVGIKLNYFRDWSAAEQLPGLEESVTFCQTFRHELRSQISAAEVSLERIQAEKVVKNYIDSPWSEIGTVLTGSAEILISDHGLSSMREWIIRSIRANLISYGDWQTTSLLAFRYHILEKSHSYGTERTVREFIMSNLPPEIWAISGIVIGFNDVASWIEFLDFLENKKEKVETLANLINIIISNNDVSNAIQGRTEGFRSRLNVHNIDTLSILVLLQFVLIASPDHFLQLYKHIANRNLEFVTVVQQLINICRHDDTHNYNYALHEIAQLLSNDYSISTIELLQKIDVSVIEQAFISGSDLVVCLSILGRLIEQESEVEKLRVLEEHRFATSRQFDDFYKLMLEASITHRHPISAKLTSIKDPLHDAIRLGPRAAIVLRKDAPNDLMKAMAIFFVIENVNQLTSAVQSFPALINTEFIQGLEAVLSSDHYLEINDTSIDEAELLSEVYWLRTKYSHLLRIRINSLENRASFTRSMPHTNDVTRNADVLRNLEITIPAGIWMPLSRIDLTEEFFDLVEIWIKEVRINIGEYDASRLSQVREHTSKLTASFGSLTESHTSDLHNLLMSLLYHSDRFAYMQDNPSLMSPFAVDILNDWILSAKEFPPETESTINRIQVMKQEIMTALDIGPEVARDELSKGGFTEDQKQHLRKLVDADIDNVFQFVDVMMDMTFEERAEIFRKAAELLDATDFPIDQLNAVELRKLANKWSIIDASINNDNEKVMSLILQNPLEVLSLDYEGELTDDIKEKFELLSLVNNNSFLTSLVNNTMDSDDTVQFERIHELLFKFIVIFAGPPKDTYEFIQSNPELLTDSTWVVFKIYTEKIIDTFTQTFGKNDNLRAHILEVQAFVENCRMTSLDNAFSKLLQEITVGNVLPIHVRDNLETITALSSENIEKFSKLETLEEQIEFLNRLILETDDSDDIIPDLYSWIGLAQKALSESKQYDLEHLNDAINSYREGMRYVDESSTRYIRLLRVPLAISLLSRFDHHGRIRSDIDEAIRILRHAENVSQLENDELARIKGHLGSALHMRFEAFRTHFDLDEGIKLLEQACKLATPRSQDWYGWHGNLGNAWSHYGEEHKDIQAFVNAAESYERGQNQAEEGSFEWFTFEYNRLTAIAKVTNLTGRNISDVDKITDGYKRLLSNPHAHSRKHGLLLNISSNLLTRFQIMGQRSDLDQAVGFMDDALAELELGSPDWMRSSFSLAQLLMERAESFSADEDFIRSAKVFQSILSFGHDSAWPDFAYRAGTELGRYYEQIGKISEARNAYSETAYHLERMRASSASMEERVRYSEVSASLFGRIVALSLQIGEVDVAFEYATTAKGRTFSDLLASEQITSTESDPHLMALSEESAILQRRLQYLRATATREMNQSKIIDYAEIQKEIRKIEARHAEVRKAINYSFSSYENLQIAEKIRSGRAKALARYLKVTLIEYYQDMLGWGAFIVTSKFIKHVRLSDIDPPWFAWWTNMLDNEEIGITNRFSLTLKALHNWFIAPLEHEIRGSERLVICPTGLMGLMPISSALAEQGSYLLDTYQVTFIPSVFALSHLVVSKPERKTNQVLFTAYPGQRETQHYLKYVYSEVSAVKQYAKDFTLLSEEQANTDNVIEKARNKSIIHFACHGIFEWDNPDGSGLMLSGGNWLTISDILSQIKLPNTYLVVLAACSVGREHIQIGDEHSSLVRAFLAAGAKTVIASLWPVDDRSTVLLMDRFYREHLLKGFAPHRALQSAQQWLRTRTRDHLTEYYKQQSYLDPAQTRKIYSDLMRLDSDVTPYSHPYFWAGFTVTGL